MTIVNEGNRPNNTGDLPDNVSGKDVLEVGRLINTLGVAGTLRLMAVVCGARSDHAAHYGRPDEARVWDSDRAYLEGATVDVNM